MESACSRSALQQLCALSKLLSVEIGISMVSMALVIVLFAKDNPSEVVLTEAAHSKCTITV